MVLEDGGLQIVDVVQRRVAAAEGPRADLVAEHLVGDVVLVVQRLAGVPVERRRVGRQVVAQAGVERRRRAVGDRVVADDAAVEPADDVPPVAEQLLLELARADAEVAAVPGVGRNAGQRRQPVDDLLPLLGREH